MHASTFLVFLLPFVADAFTSRRSALTDCLYAGNVPILLTSSPDWSLVTQPYNLRLTRSPAVVAMPRTVADVQSAVKCAAKTGTRASVKSGGHSYGAYALSGVLVIDMVEFQTVSVDPTTKIATVGAGVRLGNMATKIYSQAQRGIPHGTCAGVGIGGHATLGGFGLDSRLWGMMLDVVSSVTAVLADGSVVQASASSNKDLFWALRGAGPGFAVITQFKLKTFAAPPVNINFSYTWNTPTPDLAASVYQAAQNWGQQSAPKELGYGIIVSSSKAVVVRGVYYGSRTQYDSIIASMLAKVTAVGGNPAQNSVQNLGWIASLVALAGEALETPQKGYNEHDTFYAKSVATKESSPLSLTALKGLFKYLYTTTPPSSSDWFIISNLYGGPGSVINSAPLSTDPNSTSSYLHRRAGYVIQLYGYTSNSQPPFNNAIIGFIKNMVGALGAEAANLPAYAPYADPELSQAEAQTRYWGAGVARLKAIKAAVDPKGILYAPQGF